MSKNQSFKLIIFLISKSNLLMQNSRYFTKKDKILSKPLNGTDYSYYLQTMNSAN